MAGFSAVLISSEPPTALFQVFDGTQCVASGALRGLLDVRIPLVAGILGYGVLGLPIGAASCSRCASSSGSPN